MLRLFLPKSRGTPSEQSPPTVKKCRRFDYGTKCLAGNWGGPGKKNEETESDRYDEEAVFLGAFDENGFLAAFIRLIASPNPYMLDNEFSFLIGSSCDQINRAGTGEISRLCVDPESRGTAVSYAGGDTIIAMMIFKGLYLWCGINNISFLYAVTEPKTQRLFFMKGMPVFRLIHPPLFRIIHPPVPRPA